MAYISSFLTFNMLGFVFCF